MKVTPKRVCTLYTKDVNIFLFHVLKGFGFEPIYLDGPAIADFDRISKYLGEEWCFPVKVIFADLYRGIQDGADIAISFSHGFFKLLGPCKLPYLAEHKMEPLLRKSVKRDINYAVFNFVPPVTFLSIMNLLNKLGVNVKNPLTLLKARSLYAEGLERGAAMYDLENAFRKARATAQDKEEVIEIFRKGVREFRETYEKDRWRKLSKSIKDQLSRVKKKKLKRVLRLGIAGDYYSIAANFPHFDLENFLSKKFDAEIYQDHSVTRMIKDFNPLAPFKHYRDISRYTKYWLGGSDQVTLNSLFAYRDMKVDGIIHLKAFACMPEDMVALIVEEMRKNDEVLPPILSLGFDEHSSTEGLKTRLEAFCNTIRITQGF